MEIKKSTEYFGLTEDELLEEWNEYGYTREECKLFDETLNNSPSYSRYVRWCLSECRHSLMSLGRLRRNRNINYKIN